MYQVTVTPQFLSGKDTFQQAVPALSWAVLIFATFILMCVFDLYILVIPFLLEFISVKRSKKIRKESAKPTIITLTAKNGEIYKDNIKLNLSYIVQKNIVYIDNGHRSGKFKFYTLSFSAIITGNEVNGFIDFCLKNKVRFLV